MLIAVKVESKRTDCKRIAAWPGGVAENSVMIAVIGTTIRVTPTTTTRRILIIDNKRCKCSPPSRSST